MADTDFGDDFTPNDADPKELRLEIERKELETAPKDEEVEVKEPETETLEPEDEKKAESEDTKDKDEAADKERSKVIPRERFDKAQAKAKAREEALLTKLATLEKQTANTKVSADVRKIADYLDTKQDEYENFLIDGKKAEATAARREINQLQDMLIEAKTQFSSEAAKREAVSELKYDAALARAEADHPELNPDSEEYDESLTDEVGVLLESFVLRGFTREVALSKAVKYVVGAPAKNDNSNKDGKKVLEQRQAEARRKAADAVKRSPVDLNKSGLDSDRAGRKDGSDVDIMRISQEKFAKIDEDTLTRLRGDYL